MIYLQFFMRKKAMKPSFCQTNFISQDIHKFRFCTLCQPILLVFVALKQQYAVNYSSSRNWVCRLGSVSLGQVRCSQVRLNIFHIIGYKETIVIVIKLHDIQHFPFNNKRSPVKKNDKKMFFKKIQSLEARQLLLLKFNRFRFQSFCYVHVFFIQSEKLYYNQSLSKVSYQII